MLDLKTLKKYDTQEMFSIYDQWPKIAEDAYNTTLNQLEYIGIDHIIFTGMGGSGALGDIFAAILSKTNVHVSVIKGYLLPKTADEKTLVVTTSVSGNTIETLTILKSAEKQNCKVIAFSSGGIMESYCKENHIEHRHITQIHSPRASFPVFLFSMLKILEPIIPIKKEDIIESIEEMKKIKKKIGSNNLNQNNPAIELANWIHGIPVIYYPWGLQAAAIRFKNSLQENAKMHACIEDVIEAGHNGIVAWEKKSIIQPILLQGIDDYVKTKERWSIIKKYFNENHIDYKEIKSVNGSIVSKLINLIYLLDFSSIYHAIMHKMDPSPVKSIDFIKKQLQ